MKKSSIITLAVVGGILFLLLIGGVGACTSYNGMVAKSETVDRAWADVQSSYQRRLDLIPNLVSTVKGYAKHEKSTLADVTAMRTGNVETAGRNLEEAAAAASTGEFAGPDAQPAVDPAKYARVDEAYRIYINAVHEAYPQLMASENFMDLQKQLEGTENRINKARNDYNAVVQSYNTSIRQFPRNILANIFGFDRKQPFAAEAAAQKAVTVDFDDM